jgi:hypothetical protein
MKKITIMNLTGMVLSLVGVFLAFYWYDWKLVVILLIAITGNNLEQKGKK